MLASPTRHTPFLLCFSSLFAEGPDFVGELLYLMYYTNRMISAHIQLSISLTLSLSPSHASPLSPSHASHPHTPSHTCLSPTHTLTHPPFHPHSHPHTPSLSHLTLTQLKYKVGFVDLEDALVELDYTSQLHKELQKRRRHLFRLALPNDMEYIFQAPSDNQRTTW